MFALNIHLVLIISTVIIGYVNAVPTTCKTGALGFVDTCYNANGQEVPVKDEVARGSTCLVEQCGVMRLVDCSIGGRWIDLDGNEVTVERIGEQCGQQEGLKEKRKKIIKRGLWRRRRRSPPPPPPPPPVTCGAPGTSHRFSVSTSSTTVGGVATYTCNSGYKHTSGDLQRTCQSDSQWSGTEPTCTYMNSCSSSPCVNGGTCTNIPESYTCTCPEIWKGTRCEQVNYVCARNPCVNHVSCVDGASMYTCNCMAGWSGQICDIPVDCGHPGNAPNADVTVTLTTLGNIAGYSCHYGYNKTSGNDVRECQTDGTWSGTPPTCIYAISCSSSPCVNGGTCTNLLDDFLCTCAPGWTGKKCSQDIQPPVVDNCSGNISINATDKTVNFNWVEPTFYDLFGHDVMVTSNYASPEFEFPWGDFTVSYVATKPYNGLKTECIFTISVRPTPCEPLSPPKNGALLCNDWSTDYGQICRVTCQSNYSIPVNHVYDTWWICGATGTWSLANTVPDCSVEVQDVNDILYYHGDYLSNVYESCSSNDEIERLQNDYVTKMMSHPEVSEFCRLYNAGCSSTNVRVRCQ